MTETESETPAERAARALDELLRRTVTELDAFGARDEALARVRDPRGIGPFKTAAAMVPVGRAWRLGVLLLDREATLGATGKITRAVEPGWPTNLSLSVEERRADRLAASRGRFVTGEVVNYAYETIDRDPESLAAGSGPLSLDGDRVLVHWGPAAAERRPIAAYLADRIELLHLG
jgi:hypothetical protein